MGFRRPRPRLHPFTSTQPSTRQRRHAWVAQRRTRRARHCPSLAPRYWISRPSHRRPRSPPRRPRRRPLPRPPGVVARGPAMAVSPHPRTVPRAAVRGQSAAAALGQSAAAARELSVVGAREQLAAAARGQWATAARGQWAAAAREQPRASAQGRSQAPMRGTIKRGETRSGTRRRTRSYRRRPRRASRSKRSGYDRGRPPCMLSPSHSVFISSREHGISHT